MVYMHLLNQGRSNNFIDILNCFQDTFNATIINFIISLNKYFITICKQQVKNGLNISVWSAEPLLLASIVNSWHQK